MNTRGIFACGCRRYVWLFDHWFPVDEEGHKTLVDEAIKQGSYKWLPYWYCPLCKEEGR